MPKSNLNIAAFQMDVRKKVNVLMQKKNSQLPIRDDTCETRSWQVI